MHGLPQRGLVTAASGAEGNMRRRVVIRDVGPITLSRSADLALNPFRCDQKLRAASCV